MEEAASSNHILISMCSDHCLNERIDVPYCLKENNEALYKNACETVSPSVKTPQYHCWLI